MISQYLPPGETAIPPTTLPSQTSIIPPPLPPPHSPSLASPPSPSSLQAPIPPPPPLPPPSPASGAAPPHVFGLEKSHLLKEALEKAGPVPRSKEDVKRLLKLHKDRCQQVAPWHPEYLKLKASVEKAPFSLKQFQKRLAVDPLLCRPALAHPRRPSVRSLNRNPSLRLAVHPHSCLRCALCGLVALWMAGTLLAPPSGIPLERLMQMAVERGYSAQGEMFSVADMGRLAQEALGCQAEHLCGGLGGLNRDRALQHLVAGYPLLIPYDEDFNHEPCQKKGHKAHWAVSTGVLLGVQEVPSPGYAEDPELPGLFHPVPSTSCQPPSLPDEGSPGAVYLLSKQGKSWHYQLWDYNQVRDSNLQLMDFSPSRAADGREYVVPAGGVRAGLCGQALLLRPRDSSH